MSSDVKPASASAAGHEKELIEGVAAGDREAMAALYKLYFPRLLKFSYRITRDYGLAEEVVNDVMMVVWRKAGEFRGQSKVSTWILGIAYRQSLSRLAKPRIDSLESSGAPVPSVDYRASFDSTDWVAKALNRLPVAQRMVMELVFYLGKV